MHWAFLPILIRDQGHVALQVPVDLLAGQDAIPPAGPEGPDGMIVIGPDGAAISIGAFEPVGLGVDQSGRESRSSPRCNRNRKASSAWC